ncbi:protein-disulfide isomerase [Dyadobacter jejuensis]|uniref:Protein-disulfide isomerase n=1 Tax=Dyadobacter jejuensis TaxID=1082580 RepID=A0A316A5D7_9BACT|nr:vitamin K epoxide reductase family protein [Dyadobacter jejuensis]PWJ53101.1 protein-disulfide isomerase [Dyadobacter jejuensis]
MGSKGRNPFLIGGTLLLLAILIGLTWGNLSSTNLLLITGLKLTGTLLSGLLLWQSLDSDNPFLQSLCQVGQGNNCNGILQSSAAKLTPWLTWSDIGFLYFSGGLLALLFGLFSADMGVISILSVLSILALPYTLYSVYYQKFVAKQWCKLCMSVQVVLWLEAAWVMINYPNLSLNFSLPTMAVLILAFLIPTLIWVLVKTPMVQATQVFGLRRELQKVKFNEEYIKMVFQNQRQMPPIFTDMRTVQRGNPNATHTLTVVTNRLCGPCARIHGEINHLIEKNQQIKAQFVFLGPNKGMQIAAKFLEASASQLQTVMDSWYHDNRQDAEKWLKQYPFEPNADHPKQFQLYARWCELASVNATPTVFINGILLPKAFQIKDLGSIVSVLNQKNANVPIT